MLAFAIRRIVALVPTLFILITLSFLIIRLAPGGPFDAEQALPPAVKANLEQRAPKFAEAEVETPAPAFGAS